MYEYNMRVWVIKIVLRNIWFQIFFLLKLFQDDYEMSNHITQVHTYS